MFFCDDEIVKSSAGPKFAMYFTVTPVAERTSIAWTYVAKDYSFLRRARKRRAFKRLAHLSGVQ